MLSKWELTKKIKTVERTFGITWFPIKLKEEYMECRFGRTCASVGLDVKIGNHTRVKGCGFSIFYLLQSDWEKDVNHGLWIEWMELINETGICEQWSSSGLKGDWLNNYKTNCVIWYVLEIWFGSNSTLRNLLVRWEFFL